MFTITGITAHGLPYVLGGFAYRVAAFNVARGLKLAGLTQVLVNGEAV